MAPIEPDIGMDIRDEFKDTDRGTAFIKQFSGKEKEVARVLLVDQTPVEMIHNIKNTKGMKEDILTLRSGLSQFGKVSGMEMRVAGVPIRLLQNDKVLEITVNNHSISLPYDSAFLLDRINADICENVEIFGGDTAYSIIKGLIKPEAEMTAGDMSWLRSRCLSVLKNALHKDAAFFANLSHLNLSHYTVEYLQGSLSAEDIARDITTHENRAVEKANCMEIANYLLQTEKTAKQKKQVNKVVTIKENNPQEAGAQWTKDEKKIRNFIANVIYGEESWNTTDSYFDPSKTKEENKANQNKNRIYDMLIKDYGFGENENFDALLLMINNPDLITETIKKMDLPGVDGDHAEGENVQGIKGLIITMLSEFVNKPEFAAIRNAQGFLGFSKESVQRGLLTTGLATRKAMILEILEEIENQIDQTLEHNVDKLQDAISEEVDKMFTSAVNPEDVLDPSENGITQEEMRQRYQKLLELNKDLETYPENMIQNPFQEGITNGERLIRLVKLYDAVRNSLEQNKQEQENPVQLNENHGSKILERIITDSTKGTKGQGKFTKLILKGYFKSMSSEDQRRMYASAVRNAKIKSVLPANATDAEKEKFKEQEKGRFLGGLLKGAASVGQAFLCRAYGPNIPDEGREVVVKILRSDVRNRMEWEKPFMLQCAAETDTTGGMTATYKGQLKRFDEELDLTLEAKNIKAGRVYNNGLPTVTAMKLSDLAEPTESAMIVEKAPGTTVDRYMEEIDKRMDEILSPFYFRDEIGNLDKGQLEIGPKGASLHGKARQQLIEMKQQLERRQRFIIDLGAKWVKEGIYGAGFYHGDLHSGNIMIDDNGATVIDFGNCTKLTQMQQDKIMLMMTSATFSDVDGFMDAFKNLLSSQDFYNQHEDQLRTAFGQILALGKTEDVGRRIFACLIRAQEMGCEMPPTVFNFSQAQQRLHNTIEGMNRKIAAIHERIEQLDMADESGANEPLTKILADPKVTHRPKQNKIERLKEILGWYPKDTPELINDVRELNEAAFEAKYLKGLRSSNKLQGNLDEIKDAVGTLVHVFADAGQELAAAGVRTAFNEIRATYLRSILKDASAFLTAVELERLENDLMRQPKSAEAIQPYVAKVGEWQQLRALYDAFREIQDREGDESEATIEAKETFMNLLKETTAERLKELIDSEQNVENEKSSPQTFFDMMNDILQQNKVASAMRLGFKNVFKLVKNGRLGIMEGFSALFTGDKKEEA